MSIIKTYKGKLPIGQQEKIHLSTNNGLTGYRITKFQIMPGKPGVDDVELVGQIFLTDQTGNISATVDFSNPDLLAAVYYQDDVQNHYASSNDVIFDRETFNQDIFINITDAGGATDPANFYIELEQFSLDINSSTYHTIKNIRSRTEVGFTIL